MYDEILLPTDGSEGAAAAVEHAIHLAKQNNAIIHTVYVLEAPERDEPMDGNVTESKAEQLFDPIRSAVNDADLELVESVLEGQTHERLIEYVDEHGIDLVVMGTHGKSGISRVVLGSTAEKVVRHSRAPVLTVRQPGA